MRQSRRAFVEEAKLSILASESALAVGEERARGHNLTFGNRALSFVDRLLIATLSCIHLPLHPSLLLSFTRSAFDRNDTDAINPFPSY